MFTARSMAEETRLTLNGWSYTIIQMIKTISLFLGPMIALATGLGLAMGGSSLPIAWTAGVTCLCAIWWIFEPIPIPATSLIPIAIFPAVGVLSSNQTGQAFGSPLVLLMLGGFLLSAAMERSGAHRRIALGMVNLFGGSSGRRLVFGFMAASALLSMWISNASTTLMLLPIAMAVVGQTKDRHLQTSLLLGVAYAASVGGIATPIGSPPNLVFMQVYAENTGTEPTFVEWVQWALPITLIMLPVVGLWLTRNMKAIKPIQLPAAGSWRQSEVLTLAVFGVTALLWVTRKQPFGGWSEALGMPEVKDASVALVGAIALFVLPNGKGERLLDWETAKKIPWGILVLFAGGISIAKAFETSGLSESLGNMFSGLGVLPLLFLVLCLCTMVTFLTELTSNTATTNLLMPILAAAALQSEIDPRVFMVPAAITASFAFMLPVATPPNAIVSGSQLIPVKLMVREGFVLNLIGVVLVSTICWLNFR